MLVPWKESCDKPRQHMKKQRHHFADKARYSQSYSFSSSHIWIWELDHKEGWVLRIDAFELWCWRRLPWTARTSNQSILRKISPEYSLEGLVLKLKLQYFGHVIWKVESLEKTLMLRKTEGKRRRGWQRMRWLDSIIDSMDMNFSKCQEIVEDRGAWRAIVHGVANSRAVLSDWTYSCLTVLW